MNRNTDAEQLTDRYAKFVIIPVVIAICIWILFLNVPSANLTAFIAASGLIAGISAVSAVGTRTKSQMMVSDDPEAFIRKRDAVIATIAVIAICIAGTITVLLSNGA